MGGDIAPYQIYIRAPAAMLEAKTGLAADSTGVKFRGPKFRFKKDNAFRLILLSEITSIPSDCTVRVGVYNATKGAYALYRDYEGATGENEDTLNDLAGLDDGDRLDLRVEVIAASATAGATFDLGYANLLIDYTVGY